MNDREFLLWVYSRLHFVHGEPREMDFMLRLATIIEALPDDQKVVVANPAFIREARYIVIKRKDAVEFLSDAERSILKLLGDTIARCRRMCGRRELNCVVVESNWPEYEPTWKAIEQRVAREKAEGPR